ncbi:hypothetical protein, partial [Colidextribacter sp. OB.20]|uniref:hypothetical protein n=1 Tax=Colidextribacter sp. OB.20 TaxID=2304568 RepID=UPI001A9B6981
GQVVYNLAAFLALFGAVSALKLLFSNSIFHKNLIISCPVRCNPPYNTVIPEKKRGSHRRFCRTGAIVTALNDTAF